MKAITLTQAEINQILVSIYKDAQKINQEMDEPFFVENNLDDKTLNFSNKIQFGFKINYQDDFGNLCGDVIWNGQATEFLRISKENELYDAIFGGGNE